MQTLNDLQRLLAMQESRYGRSHAKVGNTLETMADLLSFDGKFSDAEQLYWRVFEIRNSVEGHSLNVANVLQELATLNAKQGNCDEAEHLLRRACDIKKKLCGAQSEEYLTARRYLEQLIGEDLSQEEDIPIAGAEGAQRAQDFPWTERFNRGVDLLDTKEYEGAEELFSCLVAFAEHFSPRTIQHARSLDHLARAYLFQGRFKESLTQFEHALSIFENIAGADDMDTVECLEGSADAHAALDEFEQARFLYHWALNVAQDQGFADPAERIHSKLALLPFRTPGQTVDEDQVAAARALLKPQRKKRTSAVHTSQVPPPEATPAIPSGGMKALLEDVGPPAKRKTGTFQKISALANLAQSTSAAEAFDTASRLKDPEDWVASDQSPTKPSTATPPVSTSSADSVDFAVVNPPAPPLPTAASASGSTAAAAPPTPPPTPPVFTVPDPVAPLSPPAVQTGSPPASVDSSTLESSAAAPMPTSLDELLKDLVPRRKKTTTTIMKPSLAMLQESISEDTRRRDVAETSEHGILPVQELKDAFAHQAQVAPTTPANIWPPIDASLPPNVSSSGSTEVVVSAPTDFIITGSQPLPAEIALPVPTPPPVPKPAPTFDELLAASGIIPPRPGEPLPAYTAPTPPPVPVQQEGRPAPPPESEEYLLWEEHRDLAKDYFAQRNYAEAERCSLVALESAQKLFQRHDRRLWHAHCQLAAIFEARAKFVPAGHLYSAVLKMCEKVLGTNHPDNAKILEQLGALYMVQDRWAQAEDCYVRAIRILEQFDEHEATNAMSKLNVVRKRKERMQRRR